MMYKKRVINPRPSSSYSAGVNLIQNQPTKAKGLTPTQELVRLRHRLTSLEQEAQALHRRTSSTLELIQRTLEKLE